MATNFTGEDKFVDTNPTTNTQALPSKIKEVPDPLVQRLALALRFRGYRDEGLAEEVKRSLSQVVKGH